MGCQIRQPLSWLALAFATIVSGAAPVFGGVIVSRGPQQALEGRPGLATPVAAGEIVRVCEGGPDSLKGSKQALQGIPNANCRYFRLDAALNAVEITAAEANRIQNKEWNAYVICGQDADGCLSIYNDISEALTAATKRIVEMFSSPKSAVPDQNPDQICRTYGAPGSSGYSNCMSTLSMVEVGNTQSLAARALKEQQSYRVKAERDAKALAEFEENAASERASALTQGVGSFRPAFAPSASSGTAFPQDVRQGGSAVSSPPSSAPPPPPARPPAPSARVPSDCCETAPAK